MIEEELIEKLKEVVKKELSSNERKNLIINTIGICFVALVGFLGTYISNTNNLEISLSKFETEKNIFEQKSKLEINKLIYTNEQNKKREFLSSYISSLLHPTFLMNLKVNDNKTLILKIRNYLKEINSSYSQLVIFISNQNQEEFSSIHGELYILLLDITRENDDKSYTDKIREYSKKRLDFIMKLKDDVTFSKLKTKIDSSDKI